MSRQMLHWLAAISAHVFRWQLCRPAAALCVLLLYHGSLCFAREQVELKAEVGAWGIYCIKDLPHPTPNDCSVVAATVSDSDPNIWVRVGVAVAPSSSEPVMTIRIPRFKTFRNGIALSTEKTSIGRASIEACNSNSCESDVIVSGRLMSHFATAELLGIKFNADDNESVGLTVELTTFVSALGELQRLSTPRLRTQ
jgi:invasion protein IalB